MAKIGRNEPCPCGSGLKYKKCHANPGGPPAGKAASAMPNLQHVLEQMRAIDESVEEALSRRGVRALHHEGRSQDRWIAIDYGALVVHVFLVEARRFYRLESLWEKAKPVTWNSK